MRVTFLLPGSSPTPTGGTKNIYEHANRLAAKGHRITIVHAACSTRNGGIRSTTRACASYLLNRSGIMKWRPDGWFHVDETVDLRWVPSLSPSHVPDGDAVVATAWQTAEWLQSYPQTKGKRFYFAMDYERYMEAGEDLRRRMRAIHRSGTTNMVISPAGSRMVEESGAPTPAYVPCALDFSVYSLINRLELEHRPLIGFPVRPEPHKATEDAVRALEKVRAVSRFGEIWGFGSIRPSWLPEWVTFHFRPTDLDLARLYNLTRIFIVPSHYEGWGLPGSEAMACGAALVSTDNGGVRAYAEDGRTALLTPPGDPEALAAAVSSLLADDRLRVRLAEAGAEQVRRFTWERASDALERTLLAA